MFRSLFKRPLLLVGSCVLLLFLLLPLGAFAQIKMAKADSDHYLVELKAWIPQASVPDPTLLTPFQFPNSSIPALGEPLRSCFSRAADNDMEGSTDVLSSSFHGDDHSNYGASPLQWVWITGYSRESNLILMEPKYATSQPCPVPPFQMELQQEIL